MVFSEHISNIYFYLFLEVTSNISKRIHNILPNDNSKLFEEQIYPYVNYTDMRVNPLYKNYYINWSRNLFTGVLPIVSLIIFNQLVYRKLVKRRKLWKQGRPMIQFISLIVFIELSP